MTTEGQVRLWIEGERRVWYLLLQLGVPSPNHGENPNRHLQIVRKLLRSSGGITIRRIYLRCDEGRTSGRFLFRFPRYRRNDAGAIRLAESFLYGLSLTCMPMAGAQHDSLVLRVPDVVVQGRDFVSLNDLVALEEARKPEDRALHFARLTISTASSTTAERAEVAWQIAAVTFNNDSLFNATRFLKRSHDNFYVAPGQIGEVASNPDLVAVTGSQQTDFEDALQNAFKAVEAVIGDPPKDDRRFFAKLRDIGIDPQEEVGFPQDVPISSAIRRMNEARDKRSAHGSTHDRRISAAELLEFQACAEVIVLAALEKARGTPFASSLNLS